MSVSCQQMNGVVTYYLLDLFHEAPPQVPVNITRDCIFFNKMRADLCADIFNNPAFAHIVSLIHNASNVTQINSVPTGCVCSIEGKSICSNLAGVQLILTLDGKCEHIIIQRKYQRLCYNYWKLRYFPEFIQMQIREWLLKQSWYIPHFYSANFIMNKLFTSSFCDNIHKHFVQAVNEVVQSDWLGT